MLLRNLRSFRVFFHRFIKVKAGKNELLSLLRNFKTNIGLRKNKGLGESQGLGLHEINR